MRKAAGTMGFALKKSMTIRESRKVVVTHIELCIIMKKYWLISNFEQLFHT